MVTSVVAFPANDPDVTATETDHFPFDNSFSGISNPLHVEFVGPACIPDDRVMVVASLLSVRVHEPVSVTMLISVRICNNEDDLFWLAAVMVTLNVLGGVFT